MYRDMIYGVELEARTLLYLFIIRVVEAFSFFTYSPIFHRYFFLFLIILHLISFLIALAMLSGIILNRIDLESCYCLTFNVFLKF